MATYVALELWRCIWMEKRDSRREIAKYPIYFSKKTGGIDPGNFRGVCMDDIAAVEDFAEADFLLYDIDAVDWSMIGELARRSVGRHSNTIRLLRNNSHICYV